MVQYFVTGIFIFWLLFEDFYWTLLAVTIVMLIIALVMLPFWFKTLLYKDYVGVDRPLLVQWSNDWIRFRSLFLDIKVPLKNIVEYRAISAYTFRTIAPHKVLKRGRWKKTFTLKIKVKKTDGFVESMWLSTTMPEKEELLSFLEGHQALLSANLALKKTC